MADFQLFCICSSCVISVPHLCDCPTCPTCLSSPTEEGGGKCVCEKLLTDEHILSPLFGSDAAQPSQNRVRVHVSVPAGGHPGSRGVGNQPRPFTPPPLQLELKNSALWCLILPRLSSQPGLEDPHSKPFAADEVIAPDFAALMNHPYLSLLKTQLKSVVSFSITTGSTCVRIPRYLISPGKIVQYLKYFQTAGKRFH